MLDFHLLIQHERRLYVANPCVSTITYTPEETPWTRPATVKDMTASLNQHEVEILDTLSKSYADHELSAVAESLGMATEHVAWLKQKEGTGEVTLEENYYRTSLCAAVMEAIIQMHGAITTPAILSASLADLRLWHEAYDSQLRETFTEQRAIEDSITSGSYSENAAWALARARFCRLASFWWQTCQRLGVNPFDGSLKREAPKAD